ncbi:MAG: aminoacyl-tRNA hydrolase [Bacilli bacterium]|nr:aminoacyl-tRNA hydrolase [Bacilli bacterium]
MKLIVGLGNPDKKYKNTRHNIGFSFIDYYVKYKGISEKWQSKFDGLYIQTLIDGEKVIFLKPQTYMNLSGFSVNKCMKYFDISVEDLLVVSDDLDLKVGNFKIKSCGSSGGHNGLKNISDNINTDDFKRLKIGISKDNDIDTKDYVLGNLSVEDSKVINDLFDKLCLLIDDYFHLPFSDLMSKYNRKNR